MALRLPDRWIWDSWHVDDGERLHLFFLQAPRSLGDPDLRHWHATIGHAVSDDLRHWTVVDDALGPGPAGAWDDLATWTGCVIADGDRWMMFYTGCSTREDGLVQRIGAAVSDDLFDWDKLPGNPLIEADDRWYERLDPARWHDEAWRDPWVFAAPDGEGHHALITARVPHGPSWGAGVLGHAWSPDLRRWEVRPPLTGPSGFGQLEVPQIVATDAGDLLLFSFDPDGLPHGVGGPSRRSSTYAVPADGPLGPYAFARAVPVGTPGTFAGRLAPDRQGRLHLLTFVNNGAAGFVGEIADPIPLDAIWPREPRGGRRPQV
jgi:beta-fructofuranosidase